METYYLIIIGTLLHKLKDTGKHILVLGKRRFFAREKANRGQQSGIPDKDLQIILPAGTKAATAFAVDTTTRENPPIEMQVVGNAVMLKAFSVTVVEFK